MKGRVFSLFSLGLDSLLASILIKEQGFQVVGIHFTTPFFGNPKKVEKLGKTYGIDVLVEDITEDFIKVLKSPKYGYGRVFNPCIDCKILMFKRARSILEREGGLFLVSGEVPGQRPFSQRYRAIKTIEKEAGVEGLVIRPLSAKFFKETKWEKEGLVKRDDFPQIRGRGRKVQMELARRYGIDVNGELSPSGGCILTDPIMGERYKIIFCDIGIPGRRLLELVKRGRFIRIDKGYYVIIGRNHRENMELSKLFGPGCIIANSIDTPGPTAIIYNGSMSFLQLKEVGKIIARYIKAESPTISFRAYGGDEVRIKIEEG